MGAAQKQAQSFQRRWNIEMPRYSVLNRGEDFVKTYIGEESIVLKKYDMFSMGIQTYLVVTQGWEMRLVKSFGDYL